MAATRRITNAAYAQGTGITWDGMDTLTARELAAQRRRDAETRAEIAAENGWLRAAETNDLYAREAEQDRQRAAFYGFPY